MIVTVPTGELATLLAGRIAGAEVLVWELDAPAPRAEIDLVVLPYMRSLDDLRALEGVTVRLLQSQSIGYDGVAQALGPGMTFANAKSVHEASTSELAIGLALAAQRGLPRPRSSSFVNPQSSMPHFRLALAPTSVSTSSPRALRASVRPALRPYERQYKKRAGLPKETRP
jgi:hypothetical protein